MKKNLKKFGKFFVVLSQKHEKDIRQSVLLVDGNFILPYIFALIVKDVKERFKNANIVVLTFKDKEEFIKENFPDVEVIVPESGIKPKRYQLAIHLFFLLRRNFSFIILSSLDISLVPTALIFAGRPIFLHNRWMEWYRIRPRTALDVLKGVRSADRNRKKTIKGLQDILKSLGKIFVILPEIREEEIKSRVLVEDNGYTDIGHVSTAVRRAAENFINPDITILTFVSRKHYFVDMFPQAKVVVVEKPNNRYTLAMQMYRMRKLGFSRIVLTTLDISPILVAMLYMRGEVLLYNKWHQWWTLQHKTVDEYFKVIPRIIYNLVIFIYLLINVSFVFLKRALNIFALVFFRKYRNIDKRYRYGY
jgi:hypothetical protein